MQQQKAKYNRRAFTLVELLIVIAIIAILFIVLVSKIDFTSDKAKTAGVQTDFRSYQVAFETVGREYQGFSIFGWDTGDTNGNKVRDRVDVGDTNKNGKEDADETFTGRKYYTENWTGIYTLTNPANPDDTSAVEELEKAINKELDPSLKIQINTDGTITFIGSRDPWGNEYQGNLIMKNKADRGAIAIYSGGPNGQVHMDLTVIDGELFLSNKANSVLGQDDIVMATIYSFSSGIGQVGTVTGGFTQNMGGDTPDNKPPQVLPNKPIDPSEPRPIPWEGQEAGLYESGGTYTNLLYTWDEMKDMGWINVFNKVVSGKESNIAGDLILPGDVGAIPDFSYCPSLTGVVFSEGITAVKQDMFEGSTNINHIVLPKSLQTYNRFGRDLNNLQSLYYPGNINDFFSIKFNSGLSLYSPNIKIYLENKILLKDIEFPNGVTTIPYGLFENYRALESVIIPASVSSVGARAFYCSGVKTATINGKITGTSVFADCANLETVYINNSTVNGGSTFSGCNALKKVYVGNQVTGFGSWDFFMTGGIEEVWFDGTLGDWLSMNIADLQTNPLSSSYAKLFIQNQLLTDLVVPDNITIVKPHVLNSYYYLESIKLGANVVEVGNGAFYSTKNVETIELNNKLKNVGHQAFYDCKKVRTLILPDSLESVGNAAFNGFYNVTSLVLGPNLKTIGNSAFYNFNITSLVIPDSVTTIGNMAFNNCTNVRSLTIGSGVTNIGDGAFCDFNYLTTAYIEATVPPTTTQPFKGCDRLTTIVVPAGSVNAYKTAPGWSDYADMIVSG